MNGFFKKRKGQASLEFSLLLLLMITLSTITIYGFLKNNLDEDSRDLSKIDIAAKTSVMLVNSGYNGTYTKYTVDYLGMKYNKEYNNITNNTVYYVRIYISPTISNDISNFIKDYTYKKSGVNMSKYNITVYSTG